MSRSSAALVPYSRSHMKFTPNAKQCCQWVTFVIHYCSSSLITHISILQLVPISSYFEHLIAALHFLVHVIKIHASMYERVTKDLEGLFPITFSSKHI